MGGRHPDRLIAPCFPIRVFLYTDGFPSNQSASHLDAFAPSSTKLRHPLIYRLKVSGKTLWKSVQPLCGEDSGALGKMLRQSVQPLAAKTVA
jgi:hypothetical protein